MQTNATRMKIHIAILELDKKIIQKTNVNKGTKLFGVVTIV